MRTRPLTREEMCRIIEGKGHAERVPMIYHFWVSPEVFQDKQAAKQLLDEYPCDVQTMYIQTPELYDAPNEYPSYRWSYMDEPQTGRAFDNAGFITDIESQLDKVLADAPDPECPRLVKNYIEPDGRYRLGNWWYFFFERFWSMRGMQNALMDFYEHPDEVHRLFDKLCCFYERAVERAADELKLDGIFTSDDLGTQNDVFFSPAIFDEFFAPYYKRVIDKVHEKGMHFWLHTCGNIEKILPRFIDLGIDVLHPIQKYTMDEKHIAEKYGDKITIWAGFDVQRTIPYGTPEDVRKEVRLLIDAYYRKDGRFMLTLGNGATGDTPLKSLEALLDESVSYSAKKCEDK